MAQKFKFPMEYLRVTQGENNNYSHAGSLAMDFGGKDTGVDKLYCPCDMVVKRCRQNANGELYLESTAPVEFADGTSDYARMICLHDNAFNVKEGQVIKQGAYFYDEGGMGKGKPNAFSTHVHIEAGKGKWKSCTQAPNNKGTYVIENQAHLYDLFILGDDVIIKDGGGYQWKREADLEKSETEPVEKIKIKGVDVSKHQLDADFAKVKEAGFDFAIIRCGYRGWGTGKVTQDEKWLKHVGNAITNKMPYGVYFFSQAVTVQEAIEEAQFCLKLVKAQRVQPLYPIYIDTEWANETHTGRADKLTKDQRTAVVIAFCQEIQKAGYYAGIYASTSWFKERLHDDQLKSYDKWIAQYALRCTYKGDYGMWQYGGGTNYLRSKKVAGISSDACDQNYCYKDYPTIIKNKGLNGYGIEKPTKETFTVTATEGDIDKFIQLAEALKIKDYKVVEI